jgi:hypothetical protein
MRALFLSSPSSSSSLLPSLPLSLSTPLPPPLCLSPQAPAARRPYQHDAARCPSTP